MRVYRSSINGIVEPPASKSYTHRAVFIASLANGRSSIYNPLLSRDTLATINACKIFGAEIVNDDRLVIDGIDEFDARDREIDAQNSGTTIRIAIAVAALASGGKTILTGDESLRNRPMQPLLDALTQLGVRCHATNGKPPVTVYGGGIRGGIASIAGDVSSQFISALLIASIYAKNDVIINVVGEQVSKPYIDATLLVMDRFNARVKNYDYKEYHIKPQEYKASEFKVPADLSSAALLLAAGALLGDIEVKVDLSLPQADARIIDILKAMDADIKVYDDRIKVSSKEELASGEFDLSDSPDLLPVVAILALKAKHVIIRGVKHARVKETDRIAIISKELSKLGAIIKEFDDGLEIRGANKMNNAILDSHGDHRLFMAFTIAGMLAENCIVKGMDSVDVSYPNFIDDMKRLGAKIVI